MGDTVDNIIEKYFDYEQSTAKYKFKMENLGIQSFKEGNYTGVLNTYKENTLNSLLDSMEPLDIVESKNPDTDFLKQKFHNEYAEKGLKGAIDSLLDSLPQNTWTSTLKTI